jgi:NNP family nitrate/nitrite transporter-like MFS transporter
MLDLCTSPPKLWGITLLVVAMALLGLGNGAVFQLVPQRFPKEIGVITGIVGAAGGVGGFFLPTLLGGTHQLTSSYSLGFFLIALVSFTCVRSLFHINRAWEGTFIGQGGLAPGAHPSNEPVTMGGPELAGES